MANINPTITGPILEADKLSATVISWQHLTSANAAGVAANCLGFRRLEVQIKGTWNTGTLTLQGSEDGTNYLTLREYNATFAAISKTSDPTTLLPVLECPAYVKPVLSGAGTDDVSVTLVARN